MEIEELNEQSLWERVVRKNEATVVVCGDSSKPWAQVVDGYFVFPHSKTQREKESTALQEIVNLYLTRLFTSRQVPSREELLEKRVKLLEAKVRQLEGKNISPALLPTKADRIYENERENLESKYMSKIVAIDSKSEKVAGIGDSILEAYKVATKNSTQKQFTFRRVGCNYINRV